MGIGNGRSSRENRISSESGKGLILLIDVVLLYRISILESVLSSLVFYDTPFYKSIIAFYGARRGHCIANDQRHQSCKLLTLSCDTMKFVSPTVSIDLDIALHCYSYSLLTYLFISFFS